MIAGFCLYEVSHSQDDTDQYKLKVMVAVYNIIGGYSFAWYIVDFVELWDLGGMWGAVVNSALKAFRLLTVILMRFFAEQCYEQLLSTGVPLLNH